MAKIIYFIPAKKFVKKLNKTPKWKGTMVFVYPTGVWGVSPNVIAKPIDWTPKPWYSNIPILRTWVKWSKSLLKWFKRQLVILWDVWCPDCGCELLPTYWGKRCSECDYRREWKL